MAQFPMNPLLVRDACYPNRVVASDWPQNPLRPAWVGRGQAPVSYGMQQSAVAGYRSPLRATEQRLAGGQSWADLGGKGAGLAGAGGSMRYAIPGGAVHTPVPGLRPSGGLRAGRYAGGGLGERVDFQSPSTGKMMRMQSQATAMQRATMQLSMRGVGGLGATAGQVACTSAGVAVGAYGAGTGAGFNFADMGVRQGVQAGMSVLQTVANTLCPRPTPSATPPPAAPPTGGTATQAGVLDLATVMYLQQQQQAARDAAAAAASASNTKYLVVGGVAAAAIVAALVLL